MTHSVPVQPASIKFHITIFMVEGWSVKEVKFNTLNISHSRVRGSYPASIALTHNPNNLLLDLYPVLSSSC